MIDLRRRFLDAWRNSVMGWDLIDTFRNVLQTAQPSAGTVLMAVWRPYVYRSMELPSWLQEDVGVEPDDSDEPDDSVERYLAVAKQITDAASLVLGYSVLDRAAVEYCEISYDLEPNAWARRLREREVRMKWGYLCGRGTEHILREKACECFGRMRLSDKVEGLIAVCQQNAPLPDQGRYKYDHELLEEITALRNDIVHRNRFYEPIPKAADYLEFLKATTEMLGRILARRIRVKLERRMSQDETQRALG